MLNQKEKTDIDAFSLLLKENDRIRQENILIKSKLYEIKNSFSYQFSKRLKSAAKQPFKIFKLILWLFGRKKKQGGTGMAAHAEVTWPELKIAAIMRYDTFRCFQYECTLADAAGANYKKVLQNKPDMLFVQASAVYRDPRRLTKPDGSPGNLKHMVEYCKESGIPTIFWCDDSSFPHDSMQNTIKLFDYIFTSGSAEDLKQSLGHSRVFKLMHSAQLRIHSPFLSESDAQKRNLNHLCFLDFCSDGVQPNEKAGFISEAASKLKLKVYHVPAASGLSKKDTAALDSSYKKHSLFAMNYSEKSLDHIPKNTFELLASYALVVSPPVAGLANTLNYPGTEEEADALLYKALYNREFCDRVKLLGFREVSQNHTCAHRVAEVCRATGISLKHKEAHGVSVVVSTNRHKYLEMVFKNFISQKYEKKELIIVLNSNAMDMEEWQAAAAKHAGYDIRIIRRDDGVTLGECLNAGFEMAKYPYLTKFDDDNYYAPNFLSDLMQYFNITGYDIVGKLTYYVYFEGSGILAVRYPGFEHQKVTFVAGSGLILKKEVFEKIKFPDMNVGEDYAFIKQAVMHGFKIYSADRFNYVVVRRADLDSHTWKLNDEEQLKTCHIIGRMDGYEEYVTV